MRSSNRRELKRLVDGTATTLASATFTVATNTWYTVRLDVIVMGTALRAHVNGVQWLSATDSQFASGRAGLATFNATASFDDVTVTHWQLASGTRAVRGDATGLA